MNLMDNLKDDTFAEFFRLLGYTVTWDFNRAIGKRWYEIWNESRCLCQVDMAASPSQMLAAFLTDLKSFAAGKKVGTHSLDYDVRTDGDGVGVFSEIVCRIQDHLYQTLIRAYELTEPK